MRGKRHMISYMMQLSFAAELTSGIQPSNMSQVKDGKPINVGDTVSGKVRGGKHAGGVETVITSSKEASEKGPPKVFA